MKKKTKPSKVTKGIYKALVAITMEKYLPFNLQMNQFVQIQGFILYVNLAFLRGCINCKARFILFFTIFRQNIMQQQNVFHFVK